LFRVVCEARPGASAPVSGISRRRRAFMYALTAFQIPCSVKKYHDAPFPRSSFLEDFSCFDLFSASRRFPIEFPPSVRGLLFWGLHVLSPGGHASSLPKETLFTICTLGCVVFRRFSHRRYDRARPAPQSLFATKITEPSTQPTLHNLDTFVFSPFKGGPWCV